MFTDVDNDEVAEIINEILDELHSSQGSAPIETARPGGDSIAIVVPVLGTGEGAVLIETTTDGARPLAAMLLGTGPEELDAEDVSDAVGELTNLLAGGMKSLVDEETALGTPIRIDGPYANVQPDATCVAHHALITISVSLFGEQVSAAA